MPDRRSHRGAHPDDARDFAVAALPRLRAATEELSYLRSRRYAELSALKLVGDHHQLTARQRRAVSRAACADGALARRRARRLPLAALRGQPLAIDGFNCLITLEAMLSGAPIFVGRDGWLRDLASVHGSYRRVEETQRAVTLCAQLLRDHAVGPVLVLLDRPVANSGRVRAWFEDTARVHGLTWTVRLSARVDAELVEQAAAVASSDAWVLDQAATSVDLARAASARLAPIWLVDLSTSAVLPLE